MANLKALSFVAFLVAAFIVVHCENPCRLVISSDDGLSRAIRGSNQRYFCKLAPKCFNVQQRVIGPFWKFKGKRVRRCKSDLYNAISTLTIIKMRGEDYGKYECVAKFNKRRFRATLTLREHRRGDMLPEDVYPRPNNYAPMIK